MAVGEIARTSFENPEYVAAAAVTLGSFVSASVIQERFASKLSRNAVPIADPETADVAGVDGRRTRRIGRLAYWAAAVGASAGLLHLADPYQETTKTEGSVGIALVANYTANAADMKDTAGDNTSRLEASLAGALAAAEKTDAPVSIVLAGSKARVVGNLPADDKELGPTKDAIASVLSSSDFRNGYALDEGAEEALSNNPNSGPRRVIIVAGSANDRERSGLIRLREAMEKSKRGDTLDAIVTGSPGKAETKVGDVTLKTPADIATFHEIVGEDHVYTAQSSDEVKEAIGSIIGKASATEARTETNLFGNIFILSSLFSMGLAAKRYLSGMYKGLKGIK